MIGFGCVALALPNLVLFMSVGQLFLLGVWLVEGLVFQNLSAKFKAFFLNKGAVAFSLIFFLHVAGLAYTSNMDWGLDLVRILLPFLFLPVIGASIPTLTKKELNVLLVLFVFATVATSVIGVLGWGNNDPTQGGFRELSPFISHIRMALMVVLSIFILVWKFTEMSWLLRVMALAAILWCIHYLDLMHSVQGMAILFLGLTLLLLLRSAEFTPAWRKLIRTTAFLLPITAITYLAVCYQQYYNADPMVLETLDTRSATGEIYSHDLEDPVVENGRYVWVNVALDELQEAWDTRSAMDYHGNDAKGQDLSGTLIRYMTSLDLKKDSAGISEMSDQDIANVEAGIANHSRLERNGLRNRVDMLIFELDRYKHGRDPSHSSMTMRFEFWRAAMGIWQQHFWTGVGTGDTPEAFAKQYEEMGSPLDESVRFRAHNQYITLGVSLGVIGLVLFLLALFLPFVLQKNARNGLAFVFLLAVLVSFMSDDTLERQAGATFVAFFYCILVFLAPERELKE